MNLIKLGLVTLSIPLMMAACDEKKDEENDEEDTSENPPAQVIEKEVVTPVEVPAEEEDNKTNVSIDTDEDKVGFENDKVNVDLDMSDDDGEE